MTPYFQPIASLDEPALIKPDSDEREAIDPALDCIQCGACFSSCGIAAADRTFLGPAALNRAMVLISDSRDAGDEHRLDPCYPGRWRGQVSLHVWLHERLPQRPRSGGCNSNVAHGKDEGQMTVDVEFEEITTDVAIIGSGGAGLLLCDPRARCRSRS